MAGHNRPKDGVASLAYVPAIHALLCSQGVDARDKRGHDVARLAQSNWKSLWLATGGAPSMPTAQF
jgi:hypothetical protein